MIPCDSDKIYRWNALDDLDDDISDRINDDLIAYDDPDLVMMDSFMSSASTVDDSDESREDRARDSFNDFSGEIDEDGLILALDDRTNRIDHSRNDSVAKPNNSNIVTVRVKKTAKYGSRDITASNSTEIIRPKIATVYSDGTISSVSPTGDENNIGTSAAQRQSEYTASNCKEIIRPKIATVESDGMISSVSPTGEENNVGTSAAQRQSEYAKPRIATIHSDGSISYNLEKDNEKGIKGNNNTVVEKSIPTVSAVNSDGTITYRLGNINGNDRSKTDIIEKKCPSTVATIHSDGFITYSSAASSTENEGGKSYPVLRNTPGKPNAPFDNIVTDIEDEIGDEDDDLDDDICDNLDNSRYTRSLHNMPVLEEVTEEESPLHAESIVGTEGSSTPKEVKNEPTWLELRQSPSAITTMTPRRSNDETRDDDRGSRDKGASGWQKLSGLASCKPSHKKAKHGGKYQCMDNTSSSMVEEKAFLDTKSSRGNNVLRVETCSTGSQSENDDFSDNAKDLEVGGSSSRKSIGRNLCGRKRTPNSEDYHSWSDGKPLGTNTSRRCCFRRRDWIAVIVFVLIGITVGITSFLVMHNIFIEEGENDREEGRTEEWMTIESPWAIDDDISGSDGSTASNDFDFVEDELPRTDTAEKDYFDGSVISPNIDTSMTPLDSPTDIVGFKMTSPTTSSPTPSPTTSKRVPVTSSPTSLPTNQPTIAQEPTVPSPEKPLVSLTSVPMSSPTNAPTIVTPSSTVDRMIPVVQDTETINEVIRQARRQIELLIFEDNDLIGKVSQSLFVKL
jgi:hypothetical protein